MLKLIIEDDEGRKTVVPFVRDEITIGRQEGNTIRLTERNVSRRHARLVRLNGHVVVEDLGSYNGTRINGERIAGQSPLKEGDLIQIGDYDLALQAEAAANAAASGPITAKVPAPRRPESDGEHPSLRPTMPAMEAMPAHDEDADGDGQEHTPPPASPAEARRHATAIIRLDQVEADRPRKVEVVPPDERPRLVVQTPPEFKGQEFDCVRTELRIGRTQENDIALDHRSLSRTHAKLVREDSGEWRIIDMQSANGLTVNGESYAQATLSSGDTLELGHVKLRFLGPGEAVDGVDADEAPRRSKLPVVAAFVVVLAACAAGAFFVLRPQPGTPTPPVDMAQTETPPAVPDAAIPPKVVDAVPSGEAPPETEPQTPPPAPALTRDEKLQSARTELEAREFEKALLILEAFKEAKGWPKDVDELRKRVLAEQTKDQKLTAAEKALDEGHLEDADKLLKDSAGTTVNADRLAALKTKLDAAKKKPVETVQAPPPPEKPPEVAKAPEPPKATVRPASSAEPAAGNPKVDELIADAKQLIKGRQYDAALNQAKECARLAPKNADCQLVLGSSFAFLGDTAKGKEHYRKFLDLAPAGHPQRAGVEKALGLRQ